LRDGKISIAKLFSVFWQRFSCIIQASNIQKILAAGALSQCVFTRQTGSQLEDIAAKALASSKYSDITKTLAGSVLAQANKKG
jgi:hypothetical protein